MASTYFVGAHYEVTGSTITKYYYAGTQRIAMRANGTLTYLLGDHLGSTSLTTDASGQLVSELRYKAWGEVRFVSGNPPTKYTFTGQYSYASEFGFVFYNARWYDPSLGRFVQSDTIIPQSQGIQAWDRYAYTNNNALRYTDPSGHKPCGDDAIFNCNGNPNKPKSINHGGCGNTGQRRCNGNLPTYGDGLMGPPRSPYGTFSTSFQLFPTSHPVSYGESAQESYNDFTSGGGDVAPGAGAAPGAALDFYNGAEPWLREKFTPSDQNVNLYYTTAYQNIPSVDATSVTTLNNMQIHNGSNIDSLVNYKVTITLGTEFTVQHVSAAPGQTADVPLSLSIHSGGVSISIRADTQCLSMCYSSNNAPSFYGNLDFNFTP